MSEHQGYECIDPGLGGELWRLEDPATPAELRARLETHVAYCASCRQQRAVEAAAMAGLRSGDLRLGSRAGRRLRQIRLIGGAGGLAMAAGLALMFLLPPAPPSLEPRRSDGDELAIQRPVSGEVVAGARPTLRWTAIEGATAYRLDLSAAGGDYHWQERVETPSVRVPADRPLPEGQRFRLIVEPVPAHVGPVGGLDTSFYTGDAGAFLAYRARAGSLAGRVIAVLGLGAVVAAGVLLRRRHSLDSAFDQAI